MRPTLLSLAAGLTASAAAVTASAAVTDPPQQFHLAFDVPNSAARISWMTLNATSGSCSYGLSASSLTSVTPVVPGKTYLAGYGVHHVAVLSPVTPSTTYYVACGDGSSANTSSVYRFHTPGDHTQPVSVAVMGDWGWENSTARPMELPFAGLQSNFSASLTLWGLQKLAAAGAVDAMVINGDIAYADDAFGHVNDVLSFHYEEVYNGWMKDLPSTVLTPNAADNATGTLLPFYVAPGNHESSCHSPACVLDAPVLGDVLTNFTAYFTRWANMPPSQVPGSVGPMWYSFRQGPLHYTIIDTETDFPGAPEETRDDSGFFPAGGFAPSGAYMAWLEADLAAAANDPTVSFIVAGGHRPFEDFSSSAVGALFAKYGVSVYFAGHAHSYARYLPSAYGDGTVHVTNGGAGCDEMPYPPDQFSDGFAFGGDVAEALAASAVETNRNGTETCRAWCTRREVRASFAADLAGKKKYQEPGVQAPSADALPAEVDPCRYCLANPVYTSDKMAFGVLKVTTTTLSWQLLRAPDLLVLDSFNITKN